MLQGIRQRAVRRRHVAVLRSGALTVLMRQLGEGLAAPSISTMAVMIGVVHPERTSFFLQLKGRRCTASVQIGCRDELDAQFVNNFAKDINIYISIDQILILCNRSDALCVKTEAEVRF